MDIAAFWSEYGWTMLKWVGLGVLAVILVLSARNIIQDVIRFSGKAARNILAESINLSATKTQLAMVAALKDIRTTEKLERAYYYCSCIENWVNHYLDKGYDLDADNLERHEQWVNHLESHPLDEYDRMMAFGYTRGHHPYCLELDILVRLYEWPDGSGGLSEAYDSLEEAIQGVFDASEHSLYNAREKASESGMSQSILYEDGVRKARDELRIQLRIFRSALTEELRRIRENGAILP